MRLQDVLKDAIADHATMARSPSPTLPIHNADVPLLQPEASTRQAGATSSITSVYSNISPHETATRQQTSTALGLAPSEAQARLIKDGPNELPHEEEEPLWLRFVKQFKETLILLLLASAAVSFFIGNTDDAISITIAVTIVVTVGFVQEYRSEKSLEALNKLVPHSAHVRRSGRPTNNRQITRDGNSMEMGQLANGSAKTVADQSSTTIPAAQLVPGDLALFSTGDRIPADIRITKAVNLTIDESNLTGENEPVEKYAESLNEKQDTANIVETGNPNDFLQCCRYCRRRRPTQPATQHCFHGHARKVRIR